MSSPPRRMSQESVRPTLTSLRERVIERRTRSEIGLLDFKWTCLKSLGNIPSPRHFHSCVAKDGKLYVFGGHGDPNNQKDALKDLYEYDISNVFKGC